MQNCAALALFIITVANANTFMDKKLYNHLFGSYVKSVRPVSDFRNTVHVTMDAALNTIKDLDEKNQIMTMIIWLRLSWIDESLKWNASDFCGINTTAIQSSSMWRPDITLYNSGAGDDDTNFDVTQDTTAVITSGGKVQWNFPAKIVSNCPVDVTYFPFDEQICAIEFGSWSFNRKGIDWTPLKENGDLTSYGNNVEWDLRRFTAKKKVTTYSFGEYPTVTYTVLIRRRQLFYMLNLVLPAIVITAIGMMTYCLPARSGEKVSLCVTMVISMALILLLIAESLPPTSLTTPLIGEFFAAITVMLALSTLLTVVVLQFHHKASAGRPVPKWIRFLVLRVLARLLCFHCACKDERKERENATESNDLFNKAKEKAVSTIQMTGMNNGQVGHLEKPSSKNSSREDDRKIHLVDNPVLHEMSSKLSALHDLTETRARERMTQHELDIDWMTVAMVFDRLFLVLSFVITIVTSLILLLRRPEYSG